MFFVLKPEFSQFWLCTKYVFFFKPEFSQIWLCNKYDFFFKKPEFSYILGYLLELIIRI
jgi:hypothetical protein